MALLIEEVATEAADGQVGGVPRAPRKTLWPICRSCSGPMQFLAQLTLRGNALDDESSRRSLLLFHCQNDPGLCDEWAPDSGANAALLVQVDGLAPMAIPSGPTRLPSVTTVACREYDDTRGEVTPDDAYCDALVAPESRVMGKIGGRPLWIQGDETPVCECGTRMRFLVQLEERGGGGINFGGGGAGYAFHCPRCRDAAKFLWQCG